MMGTAKNATSSHRHDERGEPRPNGEHGQRSQPSPYRDGERPGFCDGGCAHAYAFCGLLCCDGGDVGPAARAVDEPAGKHEKQPCGSDPAQAPVEPPQPRRSTDRSIEGAILEPRLAPTRREHDERNDDGEARSDDEEPRGTGRSSRPPMPWASTGAGMVSNIPAKTGVKTPRRSISSP